MGYLVLRRADGNPGRRIPAVYQVGLEGEADDGLWTQASPVVGLYCPDPWWEDVDTTGYEWRIGAGVDYLDPYPMVSPSSVIGDTTIQNTGDAAVWPTVTVRGPMTQLVAANTTRGESYTVTHTLAAGETLTVSTDPTRVIGPAGESLINKLNLRAGGIPWRVDAKSTAAVSFTVAGAAPETFEGADDCTLIRASFRQKYAMS